MADLWYKDAVGRGRLLSDPTTFFRGAPEDLRPPPKGAKKKRKKRSQPRDQSTVIEPPTQPQKRAAPQPPPKPPPTQSTGGFVPEPPPALPPPSESPSEEAKADESEPKGWAPEEPTEKVGDEQDPGATEEEKRDPKIPTAVLFAEAEIGLNWAKAIRLMAMWVPPAADKGTMKPAIITEKEVAKYDRAWAAVADRYFPEITINPIVALMGVTVMGVAAAKANRTEWPKDDDQPDGSGA